MSADAAKIYEAKRLIHPGRSSSLKKVQRRRQIEQGIRPLRCETPKERYEREQAKARRGR